MIFNPSSATVVCSAAARDGVTAIRLYGNIGGGAFAHQDEPLPSPNLDGSYTVPMSRLLAQMNSAYYGRECSLTAAVVNSNGVSSAAVAPQTFVYQPIPEAPSAVSIA